MHLFDDEVLKKLRWRRCKYIVSFFVGALLLVVGRLAYLQLFNNTLAIKAERQSRQIVKVEGERGYIYDRRMRELAVNFDMSSIYGIPSSIEDTSRVANILSYKLKINYTTLAKKLKRHKHFVWIKRRTLPEEARKIESMKLKGIGFIPETKRFYPGRELMGHILGFTDIDNHGLEGIERYYDRYLRGKEEKILLERDAYRRPVLTSTLLSSLKGKDIILTIDETIQYILEKELYSSIEKYSASSAIGIIMDPFTGEVLAMANVPRFNPNTPGNYTPGAWRNRAITDVYEPGSTFKVVVASGALEERLFSPEEIIHDGSGRAVFGRAVMHDPHPSGEPLTFRDVIVHSSNIGAAKIGTQLGEKTFYKYIKAFGFGSRTGIDLPGEVAGIVKPPSMWSGRSIITISIGQEIGVTPIQMITAMSAIANGGWLVRPHVVAAMVEDNGNIKRIRPELLRRVISQQTSKRMIEILKEVVSEGTGRFAAIEGLNVAGKTGTAQKIDPETGKYSRTKFISSFIGFFPADSPSIVMLIIINEPHGIAWGGRVAAPVFKRVAMQVIQYMKLGPGDKGIDDYIRKEKEGIKETLWYRVKDLIG